MITDTQRLKCEILDARSLHRCHLEMIGDQLELITTAIQNGRTAFINGGLEILKAYVNDFEEQLIRDVEEARKDWEKGRASNDKKAS